MGRYSILPLLLSALGLALPSQAFAADSFRLKVHGALSPAGTTLTISVYYDGDDTATPCRMQANLTTADAFSCVGTVDRGAAPRNVRVVVQGFGFQPYSRNLPNVAWKAGGTSPLLKRTLSDADADLGPIVLTPIALPRVRQVILAAGADGSQHFEISLENGLRKELLITRISVKAYHPGEHRDCCCPPTAVFEIKDEATLAVRGRNQEAIAVEYEETLHGQGLHVKAEGSIERDNCELWESLSLVMPVSVEIPASPYAGLQLVLPKRLRITGTSTRYGAGVGGAAGKRATASEEGSLESFQEFTFVLEVGGDAGGNITATYRRP